MADSYRLEEYPEHQKTVIILMKTGGLLSMIGCGFIMRDIVIKYNKGERIRLTRKIVGEMSLALFWASFFSPFMSTWMVPSDTGDWGCVGTTTSCTAQGFLDSFLYGVSISMNAILAVAYCIIVKYGRKDEARSKRSLWLILGLPPIFCFLMALKPLFNNAYNYTDFHACGLSEYPPGGLAPDDIYPVQCERGCSARELKIARFFFVCLANLIIVVSVVILIQYVISTERRMNVNSTEISNESSIKATWQGIYYIGAFMFSWFPWYIWQWIRITHEMKTMGSFDNLVPLLYIISITHPLQGVGNCVVYFRPRYLKFRIREPEEYRLASTMRALDMKVPSILSRQRPVRDFFCRKGRRNKSSDCKSKVMDSNTTPKEADTLPQMNAMNNEC